MQPHIAVCHICTKRHGIKKYSSVQCHGNTSLASKPLIFLDFSIPCNSILVHQLTLWSFLPVSQDTVPPCTPVPHYPMSPTVYSIYGMCPVELGDISNILDIFEYQLMCDMAVDHIVMFE